MNKVGILGFGGYIPPFRITTETIAEISGQDAEQIKESLLITEKSVPGKDEDTTTISVQAALHALQRAGISANKLGAVYVGSESHPYAVKPTSGIVGDVLGIGNNYTAADTEFACKAGTAALQMVLGLVKSGMIDYGLAIGADTSQSKQGDVLEYSAGAGGAGFVISRGRSSNNQDNHREISAELVNTCSFTSDTPDFWRRQTASTPEHTGRFTSEPAYFKHIIACTKNIMEKTGFNITDFNHVVFHQPNGKFPLTAGKHFGFSKEQLQLGLLAGKIGNTYSGASMLGLCNVLENCNPGEKILVTSYGSGAGSDSFVFETTDALTLVQGKTMKINEYILRKKYISYSEYRNVMELIH